MPTSRLEAFSDGVLAIVITIMVLELHVPEGSDLRALWSTTASGVLTYLLSFVYVGIYWNNHHHMFQLTERITGGVLWANLHLLFWLSLFPFSTAWMDGSHFARTPVMAFGLDAPSSRSAWPGTAPRATSGCWPPRSDCPVGAPATTRSTGT